MNRQSPTERIEKLVGEYPEVASEMNKLLDSYCEFLEATGRPEEELVQDWLDETRSEEYRKKSRKLGDSVFCALMKLGDDTSSQAWQLLRMLVV